MVGRLSVVVVSDTAGMDAGHVTSGVGVGIVAVGVVGGLVARVRRGRSPRARVPSWPTLPPDTIVVSVPSFGSGVTSVTVLQLLKRVGDEVIVGEPVMELSMDKADVEVPSSVSGVVAAVLVKEREKVPMGFPVLALSPTRS
jgi:biotin carboxyl carrier protein